MNKLVIIIMLVFILFLCFGFYSGLEITDYSYSDKKLPKEFDGYRIVFISDFHCKEFGKNQGKLISAIISCEPDIILFTGDMIDSEHNDIEPVKDLLEGLTKKYPMYAVSGNHEKDSELNYKKLLEYYKSYGVIYLDDRAATIIRNGAHIGIYGMPYQNSYYIDKYIRRPDKSKNEFNLLLYHDATAFSETGKYGYNLVLSGHTHGGIIRLPLLGGIINNNGSLFSKFDNGMYKIRESTLISNRGIGDTLIPRFYNRPEVVCITLRVKY